MSFTFFLKIRDGKLRDAIDILNYQAQINTKVISILRQMPIFQIFLSYKYK